MAATHTPKTNPVLITVTGTSDNTIDLQYIMRGDAVLIDWVSGTSVQFNTIGAVVATSGALNTTQNKLLFEGLQRGDYLYCKGGAGSETFRLTAL